MWKNKYNGQTTLEYALMIVVVIIALLAIQIYMKRGVQGKLRESADQLGEQFEAQKTEVISNTTRISKSVQTLTGGVTNTDTSSDKSTVSGKETVDNF